MAIHEARSFAALSATGRPARAPLIAGWPTPSAARVEAGALTAGTRLPAERSLAAALGSPARRSWQPTSCSSRRGGSRAGGGAGAACIAPPPEPLPRRAERHEHGWLRAQRDPAQPRRSQRIADRVHGAAPAGGRSRTSRRRSRTSATTCRTLTTHHGYWPLGLPTLRKAIAVSPDPLAESPSTPEEVLVTHGAQEAIALAAAPLPRPGPDGDPGRPDLRRRDRRVRRRGSAPCPGSGRRTRGPPRLAAGGASAREAPSLLYLMPTFQNPTGVVMPESHRREIAAIAAERGIPILEDDALANLDLGHASAAAHLLLRSVGSDPVRRVALEAHVGRPARRVDPRAGAFDIAPGSPQGPGRPGQLGRQPGRSPRACFPAPRRSATPAAGRSRNVSR